MQSGETAGRYRVLERIAAGGMGEVFRASMETVGGVEKAIALKVVKGQLARNPDFAALFVEEAKVAMTLSHANVVQSFDVGRIDDRWFLAMEHVDGVDLAQLMKACRERLGQPIPHRHVIQIAVEALKGLDYAHRRRGPHGEALSIVHRDVSPGNILVSYEGEVKVADFGIAKSAMRSFGSMAGTIKGKIPYMAPEQLRGVPVDKRADIYSVGAVMYEVLTGERVVEDDLTGAIPRVLEGKYPSPRSLEPTVSEALDRIVKKALAADPAERYASAAAMRQELEQLSMAEGYLLSSSDLADFVRDVMEGDSEEAKVSVDTAPLPVPEVPARPSEGDPFDAILGMELEKVSSGEGFSVFTSAGGKRISTAERPAPVVETGTVPGFPSRRARRRNAVVVLGGIVGALVVVGIALAMRGTGEEMVAPAEVVARDAPPAAATPPEPEPVEPEIAPEPVEVVEVAAPAPEPRRRAARRVRAEPVEVATPAPVPARATGSGHLSVNTDPWSYVYVDGEQLGPTPQLRRELAAGRHRLRLHNPSEGLERAIVIELSPGEHLRVTLDLRER